MIPALFFSATPLYILYRPRWVVVPFLSSWKIVLKWLWCSKFTCHFKGYHQRVTPLFPFAVQTQRNVWERRILEYDLGDRNFSSIEGKRCLELCYKITHYLVTICRIILRKSVTKYCGIPHFYSHVNRFTAKTLALLPGPTHAWLSHARGYKGQLPKIWLF